MSEVTPTEGTPAPAGTARAPARTYRPAADILESEAGVTVTLEMPGVAADDVDIEVEGRMLQIRGQTRARRPEGHRPVHAEYAEGDFERAFTLSRRIDPDRIAAAMADGVLTLTLPRAEAAQPSRVEVRSA